jgi:hypothetical protein
VRREEDHQGPQEQQLPGHAAGLSRVPGRFRGPARSPVGSSNSWGVFAMKKTIKVRKNSNYLGTLLG